MAVTEPLGAVAAVYIMHVQITQYHLNSEYSSSNYVFHYTLIL